MQQDWSRWDVIFCNPPFWPVWSASSSPRPSKPPKRGSTVVLLLPSWTGYEWFQWVKQRGQVQDVIGPVAFEHTTGARSP